ncbi:DUF4279 domain-containing protein [Ralstonia pickettii]|nr:DUF4279 domain-containing protein [Ralstonia pickettii]
MNEKTTVEVYLSFEKYEANWDFSLAKVTDRLGIFPTETEKKGEWITRENKKIRQHQSTMWKYSTGEVETYESEKLVQQIVHTFKDKTDIINTLKNELLIEPSLCMVVYVINGRNPSYIIEKDLMDFSLLIDVELEIDCYTYGFVEEEEFTIE